MKITPLLLVPLFLAISLACSSQTLVIEKDMLDKVDARYYFQKPNGTLKPLDKMPVVTKNSKIIFRILNRNPFCYSVTYQFIQQDIKQQYDSTATLTKFLMGDVSSFADPLKFLQAKDTTTEAGTRGAEEEELNRLAGVATSAWEEMSNAEKEQQEQQIIFNAVLKEFYNKKDSQTVIVRNMGTIIREGFDLAPTEPLQTDKLVLDNIVKFKQAYSNYKTAIYRTLARLDSVANLAEYVRQRDNLKKADEHYSVFTTPATIAQLFMIDDLPYAIANANFTYSNQEIITHDYADLSVSIVNKRRTIAGALLPDLDSGLVIPFKEHISAKGEFIVRTSIGFSFPTYFKQAVRYGVEDDKVAEYRDDNFVPNFSTFVNFYPFKGKFNNFGGVLGIGYPLTGKDKNVSVLVGISEALGDKNFVIFNLGAAVGQTNRLANGWKVGKAVDDPSVEIPTEKSWKVGLFLGITISLFNR